MSKSNQSPIYFKDLHIITVYQLTLEYLLNSPNKKPSIHILGAGISGLSAASLLKHFTPNLIVYEARDRIGGRINTQLMPGSGIPLDLGASWIHGIGKGVDC